MLRRSGGLCAAAALFAAFSFANASAAPADEFSPVMVVLDSSGSMKARDVGGSGTRMDAAKRAVSTMVDRLPAQAQVGLTIYGAGTGSAGSQKAAGCRDVRVVRPVGPVNKPALKAAVNAAKANGYTPIGQSLRTAAAQLPKEGQRSIVLVSDGEDTCAPPQPCEVAKELHRQGVDLHVHTIGFKVNPAARAQLACIAQNTGGTYHDAEDSDSLTGVLGRVTERALRHYEPVGKPIAGTADPANAPVLGPDQYVDTLNGIEERFYAAELKEGDTAYFAATIVIPRGNKNGIETLDIAITGPGGADCNASQRQMNTRAKEDGGSLTTVLRWDELADGTGSGRCDEPGRYTFRITRVNATDDGGTDRLPVELLLRIEPPVTGGKGEPSQGDLVDFAQQPSGGVRGVRGGGSFNEATTLPGPGRFGETVYYGEELFYRVKLDWGQGLAFRATYAATPRGQTTNIRTALYNPVRDEIRSDTTAYTGTTQVMPTSGKPSATTRVLYLNRTANDSDQRRMAIDGWYYIVVKLGAGSAGAGGVPVTIDLAVAGTKVSGPEYGTTEPTPSTSPTESASPSQTPDAGPGSSTGSPAEDSGSALPWVIGGVAAVLALAIVAAALILRRRRPSAPAGYGPPPGQGWPS
jgi:Ca-activated chloride channel homolog